MSARQLFRQSMLDCSETVCGNLFTREVLCRVRRSICLRGAATYTTKFNNVILGA